VFGVISIQADSALARRALRCREIAPSSATAVDFSQGAIGLPINGNFAKKSASFYEGFAKVNITLNDQWQVGFIEY